MTLRVFNPTTLRTILLCWSFWMTSTSAVLWANESDGGPSADRLWMISTRGLPLYACSADLQSPDFRVSRVDTCGGVNAAGLDDYLISRDPSRTTVVYVHGNRMESNADVIDRSLEVYRRIRSRQSLPPLDWVIWSWPSEQTGILLQDAREKASRTEAQGLYLAWLLRRHHELAQPTSLIGYSFGGRVITGALHAMAGGALMGRTVPGDAVRGANFPIGLVAPAIQNDYMAPGGYHELATQNLQSLSLLYNRRDVVLKNYWRVDRFRNADALGYSGPESFASRVDGTPLPVQSRDCAAVVGRHHSELDYYQRRCGGSATMADVISQSATAAR